MFQIVIVGSGGYRKYEKSKTLQEARSLAYGNLYVMAYQKAIINQEAESGWEFVEGWGSADLDLLRKRVWEPELTPDLLRQWRELRNLSQSQLAKLLPVPVATLQNWEQGHRNFPTYLQRALNDIDSELSHATQTD